MYDRIAHLPQWLQKQIKQRFGDQSVVLAPLPPGYERDHFIAVDVLNYSPHGTPVVFSLTPPKDDT
jgi:hypothetical protein